MFTEKKNRFLTFVALRPVPYVPVHWGGPPDQEADQPPPQLGVWSGDGGHRYNKTRLQDLIRNNQLRLFYFIFIGSYSGLETYN